MQEVAVRRKIPRQVLLLLLLIAFMSAGYGVRHLSYVRAERRIAAADPLPRQRPRTTGDVRLGYEVAVRMLA